MNRCAAHLLGMFAAIAGFAGCQSDGGEGRNLTTTCDEFDTAAASGPVLTPSEVTPGAPFEVRGSDGSVVIQVYLVSPPTLECTVLALGTDAEGNPDGAEDITSGLPTGDVSQPMFGPPNSQRVRFAVPDDSDAGTYYLCESTDLCTPLRVS